jgi:hypothetical protein
MAKMKRICELLENKGDNYILPFFWQHGEEESVLREYMGAIHSCGIGAVCVEARPHPDFAGPKWWNDMDIIMDEARRRGMRVWLLDDAHFPTGFANGALENADPKLCKQYLSVNSTDVCGPMPQAEVNVAGMAKTFTFNFGAAQTVYIVSCSGDVPPISVRLMMMRCYAFIASKLVEGSAVDDTLLDLTSLVVDGVLEWDVPDGMWRVFVIYKTRNGGGRSDYINIIDKDSCRVQIDAVYEPHYERYKEDFGKTFAGFFSDEPLFEIPKDSTSMKLSAVRKCRCHGAKMFRVCLKKGWARIGSECFPLCGPTQVIPGSPQRYATPIWIPDSPC